MANVSDELMQLRKRARRRLVGAVSLVVFALTVLWTALDGEPPKSLLENQSVEIISSAPALSTVVSLMPEPVAASEVAASAVMANVEPPLVEASRVAPVALPGKLVTHQEAAPKVVADSTQLVATPSAEPVEKPRAKATPQVTAKPVVKATPKPTPKQSKAPADPKAILEGRAQSPVEAKHESGKLYYIQIGAYADPAKAAQTVKKLKDAGVPARSEMVSTPKGDLTRVRIGPGNDEVKAKAWMQKLDALGVPGTLVVKAAQ